MGGYYIGRYEARTDRERTDGTKNENLGQITVRGDQFVYHYVTQPQAAMLSRNMYEGKGFTSDLINSYAWDTAIVFIQEFGKAKYSQAATVNSTFANKGTNNFTRQDQVCNIWDMASNAFEWTTETSKFSSLSCSFRGGCFEVSGNKAGYRGGEGKSYSSRRVSLRVILYL